MIPDNEWIGWILNNGMVNLKGHASMGSQNNPLMSISGDGHTGVPQWTSDSWRIIELR